MMLRSRSGYAKFSVKNKETGKTTPVKLEDYLTKKQRRRIGCYPDFMWQFAQRLEQEYAKNGEAVEVYISGKVKVNQGTYHTFIDPEVDMAAAKWNYFGRNEWILIPEEYQ